MANIFTAKNICSSYEICSFSRALYSGALYKLTWKAQMMLVIVEVRWDLVSINSYVSILCSAAPVHKILPVLKHLVKNVAFFSSYMSAFPSFSIEGGILSKKLYSQSRSYPCLRLGKIK